MFSELPDDSFVQSGWRSTQNAGQPRLAGQKGASHQVHSRQVHPRQVQLAGPWPRRALGLCRLGTHTMWTLAVVPGGQGSSQRSRQRVAVLSREEPGLPGEAISLSPQAVCEQGHALSGPADLESACISCEREQLLQWESICSSESWADSDFEGQLRPTLQTLGVWAGRRLRVCHHQLFCPESRGWHAAKPRL